MTARIARGSAPRPRARTQSRAKAPPKRGGMLGSDAVRRFSLWLLAGMLLALALALASAFGLFGMAGTGVGEAIGRAGFKVERVEIKGAKRVPQLQLYNIVLDQPSDAMPLVDLDATRERLLRFGWVKEAQVSRRWPDTLVVNIIERTPAAIWQHNRRLALIDNEGVVLDRVDLSSMPDLPLLIGPQANSHVGDLARLLGAAPSLKPMLAGATWIGGRRWDIRLQSGEIIALPEGEEASAKAVAHFVRMDRQMQLLGKGYERIDMRDPRQVTLDVSRQPGYVVPQNQVPAAPPQATQPAAPSNPDVATTI